MLSNLFLFLYLIYISYYIIITIFLRIPNGNKIIPLEKLKITLRQRFKSEKFENNNTEVIKNAS